MSGFLLGILTGTVAGGLLSYAKNPLSGNSIRSDVKDSADNLTDSVHRVKTIYDELEEKRMEQPEEEKQTKKQMLLKLQMKTKMLKFLIVLHSKIRLMI